MDITLAQPRGFCAGVVRAVDIVERALQRFGPPVYVYHEIVHNPHVVEDLRRRGAVFVDHIADIPRGSRTVFSAHGVSLAVVEAARARDLQVVDATCPLVTKVHLQAQRYAAEGCEVLLIGHRGHPEMEGTRGQLEGPAQIIETIDDARSVEVGNPGQLAYVTQTTLSVDDTAGIIEVLQQRFPQIQGPALEDICYATQNRQNAVKALAGEVDLVLVVGARNSSNSNRLVEVARRNGTRAELVEDPAQITADQVRGAGRIGVTAGASAPEALVQQLLDRLREFGAQNLRHQPGVEETITFRLPKTLREPASESKPQAGSH